MTNLDEEYFVYHETEASNVIKAIDEAWNFMEQTAKMDPRSPSSPWTNPKSIFETLEDHRTKIRMAFSQLREAQQLDKITDPKKCEDDDIKMAYIDMMVSSFGDHLNEIKETDGDVDVDLLADCLQSGIELWSQTDKIHFMAAIEGDEESQEDEDEHLPVHKQRQQLLGLSSIK